MLFFYFCFCKYYKVFRSPQLIVSNELVAKCTMFVWVCSIFFLMRSLIPFRTDVAQALNCELWQCCGFSSILLSLLHISVFTGVRVSVSLFLLHMTIYFYYFKNTFVQRQCRRTYICVHVFLSMFICMYVCTLIELVSFKFIHGRYLNLWREASLDASKVYQFAAVYLHVFERFLLLFIIYSIYAYV